MNQTAVRQILRVIMTAILAVAAPAVFAQSAATLHIVAWRPAPHLPVVLLPRTSRETPRQAVEAYVAHLYRHPGLTKLIPPGLDLRQFSTADAADFKRKDHAPLLTAFIANQIADLVNHDGRVGRAIDTFSKGPVKIEPYVLALAAAHRLSSAQQDEYEWKVAELFELVVGLGGEDWSPVTYKEEVTDAVDFNPTLDIEEIELRKKIIKAGKAFRALICRSHQIEMVILRGMTLIQDLEKEGFGRERDHRGPPEARIITHPIKLRADSRIAYYLRAYFQKHNLKPVDGWYEIPFNSWHHQAVDLIAGIVNEGLVPDSQGRDVAYGPNGILEMTEGPNFVSFQGHIELNVPGHGTEVGDLIIQGIKEDALEYRRRRESVAPTLRRGLTPKQICEANLKAA